MTQREKWSVHADTGPSAQADTMTTDTAPSAHTVDHETTITTREDIAPTAATQGASADTRRIALIVPAGISLASRARRRAEA
jgi:hypothetical protein